jgi:hypothetical protein
LITARGGRLRLQLEASGGAPPQGRADSAPSRTAGGREPAAPVRILTAADLQELERENLRAALARAQGKIYGPGGAAELLGLPPTTLTSQLQRPGCCRAAPRADRGPGRSTSSLSWLLTICRRPSGPANLRTRTCSPVRATQAASSVCACAGIPGASQERLRA